MFLISGRLVYVVHSSLRISGSLKYQYLYADNNPPDNEGPDDPHNNPDDSEHGMQNNLADTIATLARNVQHQRDSPCSKVREPDPFDGTDPAKLWMFLIQLWLSLNDHPCAFADDCNKVNFAISYLKGIALAHFENSLIVKSASLGWWLQRICLRVEDVFLVEQNSGSNTCWT